MNVDNYKFCEVCELMLPITSFDKKEDKDHCKGCEGVGFVYVVHNPIYGSDMFKVGKTIDRKERLNSYNQMTPYGGFEMIYYKATKYYSELETELLAVFDRNRTVRKYKTEWLKLNDPEEIFNQIEYLDNEFRTLGSMAV